MSIVVGQIEAHLRARLQGWLRDPTEDRREQRGGVFQPRLDRPPSRQGDLGESAARHADHIERAESALQRKVGEQPALPVRSARAGGIRAAFRQRKARLRARRNRRVREAHAGADDREGRDHGHRHEEEAGPAEACREPKSQQLQRRAKSHRASCSTAVCLPERHQAEEARGVSRSAATRVFDTDHPPNPLGRSLFHPKLELPCSL